MRVDVLEADGWRELPTRLEEAREVDARRPIERRQEVSVIRDRLLLRRICGVEDRLREREVVQVIREPERVRPRESANLDRRIEARARLSRALIELDAIDADAIQVWPIGIQVVARLVDVQRLAAAGLKTRRPCQPSREVDRLAREVEAREFLVDLLAPWILLTRATNAQLKRADLLLVVQSGIDRRERVVRVERVLSLKS